MAAACDQVVAAERVPALALSTSSLECGRRNTAKDVHAVRDCFEVIHAHATVIAADVIQLDSRRKWPAQSPPDPEMSCFSDAVQHRLGVAMIASRKPARGDVARPMEIDLVQQALWKSLVTGGDHQPKGTS
jgi:hypothetical protein